MPSVGLLCWAAACALPARAARALCPLAPNADCVCVAGCCARLPQAYVLLGNELPEGETAYVLTRNDNGSAVRLWNAHTGRVYSKDDAQSPLSACPLTSVGCVFNDKNIWANIQLAERYPTPHPTPAPSPQPAPPTKSVQGKPIRRRRSRRLRHP